MNIVKLKDEWFDATKVASTDNTYNKYFANKYVLAPRFSYLFTLESLSLEDYILIEKYGIKDFVPSELEYEVDPETDEFVLEDESVAKKIKEVPYITIVVPTPEGDVEIEEVIGLEYTPYESKVNTEGTLAANSISRFISENNYISDVDISIDELRNFRTWLATSLLQLEEYDNSTFWNEEYEEDVDTMLHYYAENMYDAVIRAFNALNMYATTLNFSSAVTSSCGCTSNVNGNIAKTLATLTGNSQLMQTLDLSNITIANCDPIEMYRRYIYNCMVATFRETSFWSDKPKAFIFDFARYIRGIIDNNFPLYQSNYLSTFADCGCLNDANSNQATLIAILEALYKSLMYIYNDEISGHKNYIADSLYNWASKLYEKMIW